MVLIIYLIHVDVIIVETVLVLHKCVRQLAGPLTLISGPAIIIIKKNIMAETVDAVFL